MKKCVYDAESYCAAKSSVRRMVLCSYPESCELFATAIDMDPPLELINRPPNMEYGDGVVSMTGKIGAEIVNRADKLIINSILDYAERKGITELYLLDESFVRSALLHEAERMKKLRFEELEEISKKLSEHMLKDIDMSMKPGDIEDIDWKKELRFGGAVLNDLCFVTFGNNAEREESK